MFICWDVDPCIDVRVLLAVGLDHVLISVYQHPPTISCVWISNRTLPMDKNIREAIQSCGLEASLLKAGPVGTRCWKRSLAEV